MKEILKKRSTKIGIGIICILVIMMIVGITAQNIERKRVLDNHIAAGQKFLDEMDYEQAIAELLLALSIDPKNQEIIKALEEAYLAYADFCIETEKYDMATTILEAGYEEIKVLTLSEKLSEVKEIQEQKALEEEKAVEKAKKEEEERQRQEEARLAEQEEDIALAEEANVIGEEEEVLTEELDQKPDSDIQKVEQEIVTSVEQNTKTIEEKRAEILTEKGSGYAQGQIMPDFTMTKVDGSTVNLSSYLGKKVHILYFSPFLWSMSPYDLAEAHQEEKANPNDVVLYVSNVVNQPYMAQFQEAFHISFPVLYVSGDKLGDYVIADPATVMNLRLDEYGAITQTPTYGLCATSVNAWNGLQEAIDNGTSLDYKFPEFKW